MLTKEHFVKDLTPGSAVLDDNFLVAACEMKTNRKGAVYLNLTLKDRTGEVKAKRWDHDGGATPVVDGFVKVRFEVGEYNDELQLKVLKWRPLEDDEVVIEDFIRASERNRAEMLSDVRSVVWGIGDFDLRSVVSLVLERHAHVLIDAPAAKVNHQPYLGGLSEHILALSKLAWAVYGCYGFGIIDIDLLLAASVVHDMGKCYELNFRRAIGYTRRGTFVGHIGIGLQMLAEARNDVDPSKVSEKLDILEHIVASHHGLTEWGALTKPMTLEANIFHQMDMIDSQVGFFAELKCPPGEFVYRHGERYYVPAGPVPETEELRPEDGKPCEIS